MLLKDDIVPITLDSAELKEVLKQSKLSSIGGRSNARSKEDRAVTLIEDQISGHACHMAASKHLYGSIKNYLEHRDVANASPYASDGHVDFAGTKIDVKGGNKRKDKSILDYNLIVPANEYFDDLCYISALTKFSLSEIENKDSLKVVIIGWASADMLEEKIFFGKKKYMLKNYFLHPLPSYSSIPSVYRDHRISNAVCLGG